MKGKEKSDGLKFLLVGPGLIGKQHALNIASRDDCVLEAIVTPEATKYESLVNELGTCCYQNLSEALRECEFDAVIISSPNEFHYDQAVECIDAGLPSLVEKPLTSSISEAEKLVAYSESKGVPVLVGHHRTYSSFLPAAKAFINSEQFGDFISVQGSAQFYKPADYFLAGPWRTCKGGGPILINLIHEIGIMRELCGEIEKVFAMASHKARGYEVEDTVSICFEFENGTLGNFILSDTAASNKSWEMTSGENPAYPHYPAESCYHFAGTKGSLDFPNMRYRTYAGQEHASWWKPFVEGEIAVNSLDPLKSQLAHFIDVINGGASPLVSARSGYQNMRVLEAVRQSVEEGRCVTLRND